MKNIHIYIFLFVATFLLGIFWQPLIDIILRPLLLVNPPIFLIIATVLIFISVFLFSFLSAAKPVIIKSLSEEQEFSPIEFCEFSNLDVEKLASYTRLLEYLGFNCLGDYQLTHASTKSMTRMFAHPQHHCFAGILQTFSEQRSIPMFYSIESAFEQGWSLSHRNYNMSGFVGGISYMMRQKRHLWAIHSNASPEELLRIHLECRQQIVADLNLKILTDMSVEAFISYTRDYCRTRYQVMKKKSLFIGLIEAYLFSLHPKSEWMGEYAARRKI